MVLRSSPAERWERRPFARTRSSLPAAGCRGAPARRRSRGRTRSGREEGGWPTVRHRRDAAGAGGRRAPTVSGSRSVVDGAALVQMEGSVLHDRKAAGPARGRRMLLDDVPNPSVRRHVLARQVIERECLADSLPQLVGDELELRQQPLTYGRILERLLEATIPALPLL